MESLIAGRFEVLAPVRSGAMGEVVKAKDHAPGEGQASDIVAVKRILCRRDGAPLSVTVGDELVQRFAREVRITEKVSSPHLPAMIVGGLEGGTDDKVDGGVPYFAMEFIDGDNVKDLAGEVGRLWLKPRPAKRAAVAGAPLNGDVVDRLLAGVREDCGDDHRPFIIAAERRAHLSPGGL